jgi:UDP-N-acetylglucosamine acyltransferase
MSIHSLSIHPSAIIDPTASLGQDVEVGPLSYIGPGCEIGNGCKILPHAILEKNVILGENCEISPGAVVGGKPQDLKFKGQETFVRIGRNTIIRECVTINRANGEDGAETLIGERCMLMAYSHVAHNCIIGNEVIMANNVQMGGHVEIGDFVFLGGTTVFHQFVKIGTLAIVSGFSGTRQDIPPFSMTDGRRAIVAGINKVGLKRRGYDLAARTRLKKAFQLLFFSGMNYNQALAEIKSTLEMDAALTELVDFMQNSSRGVFRPNRILQHGGNAVNQPIGEDGTLSETLM